MSLAGSMRAAAEHSYFHSAQHTCARTHTPHRHSLTAATEAQGGKKNWQELVPSICSGGTLYTHRSPSARGAAATATAVAPRAHMRGRDTGRMKCYARNTPDVRALMEHSRRWRHPAALAAYALACFECSAPLYAATTALHPPLCYTRAL